MGVNYYHIFNSLVSSTGQAPSGNPDVFSPSGYQLEFILSSPKGWYDKGVGKLWRITPGYLGYDQQVKPILDKIGLRG